MPVFPLSLRAAFLAPVAVAGLALSALPALANPISVTNPYVRVSGPQAKSGAIFMEIDNAGALPDTLVAVRTKAANKAELHGHSMNSNGVMKMFRLKGALPCPPMGNIF